MHLHFLGGCKSKKIWRFLPDFYGVQKLHLVRQVDVLTIYSTLYRAVYKAAVIQALRHHIPPKIGV